MCLPCFLYNESQTFDLTAVLNACGYDIDPRGIDAAVAQNICQFGDVLFAAVKCSRKQLTQVMGKHFAFLHTCRLANCFI